MIVPSLPVWESFYLILMFMIKITVATRVFRTRDLRNVICMYLLFLEIKEKAVERL